ncbi:hemolysin family protein [Nesterenkonia sp.]|uniref:hemolysin family protein n=1 Tax=Nesterenkonia sp. TaxID=704201 RepID=UPI00262F55EC|nr:hemolysin family protein [Nesterenkonia sp.]
MTEDLIGLIWLVVLLAGNAFFVAGEFAVLSARRSQIEPKAETGSTRARTALYAMEHVSQMLAVAQLGITVCSLLLLIVAEPAVHHLLAVPFEAAELPAGVTHAVSLLIALLFVSFLHVTFGEMIPKNYAVSMADRAVLLLAPPMVSLYKLLMPVIWVLNSAANVVLRLFRVTPRDEVISTFTLEEMESILAESKRGGTVTDEAGIIAGALEFTDRTAAEVMVPTDELVTVPLDVTPQQVEKAVGKTGFSRFVVAAPDGGYTGYLHLKDIMALPSAAAEQPVPVTAVRSLGNMRPADDLETCLARMQASGSHLARVIDDDGVTRGILFLEDVLEVLVGEINDATQARDSRRKHQI